MNFSVTWQRSNFNESAMNSTVIVRKTSQIGDFFAKATALYTLENSFIRRTLKTVFAIHLAKNLTSLADTLIH